MNERPKTPGFFPLWEEEALFARDMEGQLIRTLAATQKDYDEDVNMTIDGEEVTIKRAVPLMDSQGNILKDANGRTTPRKTTIYDAATKLYNEKHLRGEWLDREHPIPTLCHREHLRPVGVCRVCAVEVSRRDRDGNETLGRKLLPACHHPVNDAMIVHTLSSPNEAARRRVYRSVKVLAELLVADHLHEENPEGPNELQALQERLGLESSRFRSERKPRHDRDLSSFVIQFNRDACILCQRCSRACNEIKGNQVIGKTGKGYQTKVSFDLDDPMGQSSCVSCGECMITCPTDALTFVKTIESDWRRSLLALPGYSKVSSKELREHSLFRDISYKFVQWNEGAIVRWRVRKGDVLYRQGEYGATAFIIHSGRFGVWGQSREKPQKKPPKEPSNWLGRLFGGHTARAPAAPEGEPETILTRDDLIFGEMSCMNAQPRAVTVAALEDGEVFVVRRNILYALKRHSFSRGVLDAVYRERSLITHVREVPFFEDLSEEERTACREFLHPRASFVRVDPGQVIFREGEEADAFFMIRIGHVKVSKLEDGQEIVLDYLRPNSSFGEVGLVDPEALGLEVPLSRWRRRAATCRALDNVELIRISAESFHELIERFSKLKERFVRWARSYLERERFFTVLPKPHRAEFLDQGLFNAQKLLVLDLERCTRCDQCVKACADTHGGVTRLVREGLRFDRYLVASACRSCTDPYCLVGCPVDAIHRKGSTEEIVIESHCIGCGQCANNCPYGNINMHGVEESRHGEVVIQQKATTCDLCTSVVGPGHEVSCVYACPHEAAERVSGAELWDRMERGDSGGTLR